MFCTNCGHPHEVQALFCTHCGQKLKKADIVSTAPTSNISIEDDGRGLEQFEDIDNPNVDYYDSYSQVGVFYKAVKKYSLFAIPVFLIWSFFSLVKVRGEAGVNGIKELDGISGKFSFTGWQMLSGELPKFTFVEVRHGVERARDVNNALLNIEKANIPAQYHALFRTPLYFRISYFIIIFGSLLLVYSAFFADKETAYKLTSVAKIIGFFGTASFMWSYNEFQVYGDKILSVFANLGEQLTGAVSNIGTHYSFPFWMLFLIFLMFTIEYVYINLKDGFNKLKNIQYHDSSI